ncbi:hypothetical protein ALQ23_04565 [Pseudomonas syringae pv. antirrhini]|nr:hypothetical protein ALQ23_04565 [Pseudomonas syringae pv. antirrhini]
MSAKLLALDLATHDPVEYHDQYGHADGNVLKGLFSDDAAVLQMRQAEHDRQNAEGDQKRVNQTLFVGHNDFLKAHDGQLALPVCAHSLRRCAAIRIVRLPCPSPACTPHRRFINRVDDCHAAMNVAV